MGRHLPRHGSSVQGTGTSKKNTAQFGTFTSKKRGALWSIMTDDPYSRGHLFDPKHVTLSREMHLALLASIPSALLISNDVLPYTHREVMSREMFEKWQLVRARSPCEKVCKARATSAWHGRTGRIEILWWKTGCPSIVTGGDFPVEKRVRDRRNQQRLHIFYHVLAAQRRSNTSFFLAWRLVDILDEHYSFSVFFSKLCCALRGLRGLVRKGQEMKADIRSGASLLKPKKIKTSSHDA